MGLFPLRDSRLNLLIIWGSLVPQESHVEVIVKVVIQTRAWNLILVLSFPENKFLSHPLHGILLWQLWMIQVYLCKVFIFLYFFSGKSSLNIKTISFLYKHFSQIYFAPHLFVCFTYWHSFSVIKFVRPFLMVAAFEIMPRKSFSFLYFSLPLSLLSFLFLPHPGFYF